jgi:hypothetical protein
MSQPTRAFKNIKLTFNENPTSTAPRQIQIGQPWLWEILEEARLSKGHQKSGHWFMGYVMKLPKVQNLSFKL